MLLEHKKSPFPLESPVSKIPGVGEITAKKMTKAGVNTIEDLLYFFPRDFRDLRDLSPIKNLRPDESRAIKASITQVQTKRTRFRRFTITEALLTDGTGYLVAVWFNQPYLSQSLKKGRTYLFFGPIKLTGNRYALMNPFFEEWQEDKGYIMPLYPEAAGLSTKFWRKKIQQVLPSAAYLMDFLADEIKKKNVLIGLSTAIFSIHAPENPSRLKLAKRRLAFDELFLLQLAVQKMKQTRGKLFSLQIKLEPKLIKKFLQNLPFILTKEQKQAAVEIFSDLRKSTPMNRLLEGDVGTGKTVVAALVALQVGQQNFQTVFLAPTEILAFQHFQTLSGFYKKFETKIAILTRSQAAVSYRGKIKKVSKTELKETIKQNQTPIIIGTHALLQEDVFFPKLALIIVDEQHRFGVKQRELLTLPKKKTTPHFLSLTATPIPRTLALTLYGNLDISVLTEKLSKRKPVQTKLVLSKLHNQAYEFIRKILQKKQQVFVITPLIAESEKLTAKAAETAYQEMCSNFPDYQVALLHGRMRGEEKNKIMQLFKNNKIQILVSTSVVEVGIDVPNATVMIIESAERFGLAQLHQLRGRVGRGEEQSYCFLFSEEGIEETLTRLKEFAKIQDGFKLSELDLRLRGPGSFFGVEQSGFLRFKIANLSDIKLIKESLQAAREILDKDPNLVSYPLLKEKMPPLVTTHQE